MPPLRAFRHMVAGTWPASSAVGSLTLVFDVRHRRRCRLVADDGSSILLDLDRAVAMGEGDGLELEDGSWMTIHAAHEPVVEIRHRSPEVLMRLAWHLGNRHLATEIREGVLRIRPDHVIEAMLERHGATLARLDSSFQPEGGAYGGDNQPHRTNGDLSYA